MDSMGFFSFQKPIWGTSLPPRQKGPRVGDALHLERNFVETVRWTFPQSLSVFLVFLETNYFFRFQKWNSSKMIMKSKLDFLNTCLLTKRLQVGKSNIPIHVSIWFFRLFPTWRVVPNTYFGWGLGEVHPFETYVTEGKTLLQSPKGLLVKLLMPFSISSPQKDHF